MVRPRERGRAVLVAAGKIKSRKYNDQGHGNLAEIGLT
jgi:hypothetical protein